MGSKLEFPIAPVHVLTYPQDMGKTTDLRRAVKEQLIPLLLTQGFCAPQGGPQSVTLVRTQGDQTHICEIQWERYGKPRFALDLGRGPAGVREIHNCTTLMRLIPGRSGGSGSWFRQDRHWLLVLLGAKAHTPESVVAGAVSLWPEAEAFLTANTHGPHLRLIFDQTVNKQMHG